MNIVEFLTEIWPSEGQGIRVLATYPHWSEKAGRNITHHHTFADAKAAASFIGRMRDEINVYYAVHTFATMSQKTSATGKVYEGIDRTAANALLVRAAYADLDVGEPEPGKGPKYRSQPEALAGLKAFLLSSCLPKPWVVSSGYGIHVYWIFDRDVSSAEWIPVNQKLKAVMVYMGLLIDVTVTGDAARILRSHGSVNHKIKGHPVKVTAGPMPERVSWDDFVAKVEELYKLVPAQEVREATHWVTEEMPTPKQLAENCPAMVKLLAERKTADEPRWYAMLQVARHTTGGDKFCHVISRDYPDYSPAETQGKLDRLREDDRGPSTCGTIEKLVGSAVCRTCKHWGLPNSSPVVFARRAPEALPAEIPPPERPWLRTKRGIEYQELAREDEPAKPPIVIYGYDFYPTQIVDDPLTRQKAMEWVADLPLQGKKVVRLAIDAYTQVEKMVATLVNQGVTVDMRHAKRMGEYVSHYIKVLQAARAESTTHSTFGWDLLFKMFLWGDQMLSPTGRTPATIAASASNALHALHTGGTREGQLKALKFYNDPRYVRQQFIVCCALGAPLLYKTGHHGLLLNVSGPSGNSKTSVAYAGGGAYGDPVKFVLNGTTTGFTPKARIARMRTLGALPIILDETTNMPAEAIKEMAMAVTQPGHTGRLDSKGQEIPVPDSIKSTMMITTSNNSMHSLLSLNNQAGNAGSMRVFEVISRIAAVHTKREADQFLRDITENYGWLGPDFIENCLRNPKAVDNALATITREIEERGKITPAERFWSAAIAIGVLACSIAKAKGWLDYDPEEMMRWAIEEQLPAMRGVVSDAYLTPAEVLHQFLLTSANALLVVEQQGQGYYVQRPVNGKDIVGRLEQRIDALWLSVQAFRRYCDQHKHNYDDIARQLIASGVCLREKMNLTRHVDGYTGGTGWTLRVDLRHVDMTGSLPIETSDGAQVYKFPVRNPALASR